MSFPVYLSPSPPSSEHPPHAAFEDTRPRALLLGAEHTRHNIPSPKCFVKCWQGWKEKNCHQSAELPSCGAASFPAAGPHWWQILEGRLRDAVVHRGSSSAFPLAA